MKVRRRGKERREPLPEMMRRVLESGADREIERGPGWFAAFQLEGLLIRAAVRRDPERRCDLWDEHGADVLEQFVRAHPGARPYAWWALESPEPRRVVAGAARIRHLDPLAARLNLGRPFEWHELLEGDEPIRLESQAEYLRRLRVLSPAEHAILGPEAFEPETVDEEPDAQEAEACD
jgi:hypothetical protein